MWGQFPDNKPILQDCVVPGSIAFSEESGTEPVSLEEAKMQMHIGYSSDDDNITLLIKAAREWVEKQTGISLIERDVTCTLELCEGIELPYGPVTEIITIPEQLKTIGGPFLTVYVDRHNRGQHEVKYSAGYTVDTIPASLKLAIMQQVAFLYENKGESAKGAKYSPVAESTLTPFIRMTWV